MSLTLEEKGVKILEAIKNVREKHREMDEKLQALVRIATYYKHGIDPQEIEYPIYRRPSDRTRGVIVITMKDGSEHCIPEEELDNADYVREHQEV